jgi:hypothetical protein
MSRLRDGREKTERNGAKKSKREKKEQRNNGEKEEARWYGVVESKSTIRRIVPITSFQYPIDDRPCITTRPISKRLQSKNPATFVAGFLL